jgi:hypothetical protein
VPLRRIRWLKGKKRYTGIQVEDLEKIENIISYSMRVIKEQLL